MTNYGAPWIVYTESLVRASFDRMTLLQFSKFFYSAYYIADILLSIQFENFWWTFMR